jgi:hypothetical protein
MDYIGKRISIQRKEDELSIVILSFQNKVKNIFLFIWILLWSLSGMIVLTQYFLLIDADTKTAIIVWMGFWIYFEYKIVKAYRWRRSGKEIIKIREGKLFYKRDVSGKGKIKNYVIDFIKDLRLIEPQSNSFFKNLTDSYWVIANEKLVFDYYGTEIKFGIQLDEADAKALLKLIKNKIGSR